MTYNNKKLFNFLYNSNKYVMNRIRSETTKISFKQKHLCHLLIRK